MKPGPKAGHGGRRLQARFSRALQRIGLAASMRGNMARIPFTSLAETLECRRQTLVKLSLYLRQSALFFQGYHSVMVLTYERQEATERRKPVLWIVNRHSLHRIYAQPGMRRQLRWHIRKGRSTDWKRYLRKIKLWAEAMIFRGKESERKRKVEFYLKNESSERGPPKNLAAWRRFRGYAVSIDSQSQAMSGFPQGENIVGWCVNRLIEEHEPSTIVSSIQNAVSKLKRRTFQRPGTRLPPELNDPLTWLLGAAKYWLNSDGLVPVQRRYLKGTKEGMAGFRPPAFKERVKVEPRMTPEPRSRPKLDKLPRPNPERLKTLQKQAEWARAEQARIDLARKNKST